MSERPTPDVLATMLEWSEKAVRERDMTIDRLRDDLDGTFAANEDMYRRMVEATVEAETLRFERDKAERELAALRAAYLSGGGA